ncbi:MAG: hypothetical protein OMM_12707, partial [Candidatus Magnetoglobus multicellularis str. Araruama]
MKILVVGCGSVGKRHAENVSKLAETAVVDIDNTLSRKIANKLNIQVFPDLQSGLSWKPDGVIVSVPTHLHISIADLAVESGAHVLVEKPLSNNT